MQKKYLALVLLFLSITCYAQTYHFVPDTISLLRNPAMGWQLYEEGASFNDEPGNYYNPVKFWEEMDEVNAAKYANILYIRVTWKVMEPAEGKYAWIYNSEYKQYIKQAQQRGLKLAFRIFFDNGVPAWVYEAGCHSTLEPPLSLGHDKMPYFDDPVFLEKLQHFIKAFAKEYDDPSKVDFVDAYGLGRWGEGHGVTLKDKNNYPMVMQTVTKCYADNFKKILTVINLSQQDWKMSKPLVYDRLGFLPRRDGIGSHYYSDQERGYMMKLFPKKAIIGEGCYWFGNTGRDSSFPAVIATDTRFPGMTDWVKTLTVSINDALASNVNTFDLRTPFETKLWIEKLPGKVQQFIGLGGYRFIPTEVNVKIKKDKIILRHSWINYGIGILPNRHPNWNKKYKVSFALMDLKTNKVEFLMSDKNAEPADWVKGRSYRYQANMKLPKTFKKGVYSICMAITDNTKNNLPGIILSIENDKTVGGWTVIDTLAVK